MNYDRSDAGEEETGLKEQMEKRLASLLSVKSVVTITLTAVIAVATTVFYTVAFVKLRSEEIARIYQK